MRWFRHYTNANQDEGIRKLVAKMGMEGVGMWWTLLEIIASKMDETDRCHATFSVQDWCSFLKVKQKKLSYFLEQTEFELGIKSVYSENELRIECRNLLKYRDEYTRKSGQTPDKNPPQSQKQIQNQIQRPIPPPSGPPQAQTGVERPDGLGGGSVVLEPEGRSGGAVGLDAFGPEVGGVGKITNPFRQVAESLGVEIQTATDQSLAPKNGYANKSDYHRDFVKEQLARYAEERKDENARIDRETAAGVGKWTAEFASLIKNCDLETRDEIRTAIANLKSQDQLQDTLDKAKQFIESGQSKSPKGLILHRIKQLG